MGYGFRLFEVALYSGNGRSRADFAKSGDDDATHYGPYASGLIDELRSEDNLDAFPNLSWSPDEANDLLNSRTAYDIDSARIRWLRGAFQKYRVSMEFDYGTVGDHHTALAAQSTQDASITGKAPAKPYRAELVMPASGDGHAILAVESSGRTCPVGPIIRWLTTMSKIHVVRLFPDEDEAEKRPSWWRVKAHGFADLSRITEIISQSEKNKIVLTRHGTSGSGRQLRNDYRFEAPLQTTASRTRAIELARRIVRAKRGDMSAVGAGSTTDLLKVAAIDDVGDLKFDDGYIYLSDGQTGAKVGLSYLDEIFTYPTSMDLRPSTDGWELAVRGKLDELAAQFANDIVWG